MEFWCFYEKYEKTLLWVGIIRSISAVYLMLQWDRFIVTLNPRFQGMLLTYIRNLLQRHWSILWGIFCYSLTLRPSLIQGISERGLLDSNFGFQVRWGAKRVLDRAEILWNEIFYVYNIFFFMTHAGFKFFNIFNFHRSFR